jgi:2-polyprenyl-3-methyl-5-hydroxy-6-metoxy-1,4-benzoquinol methylase
MNKEVSRDARRARSPFTGAESNRIWGWSAGRPIFQCPDTGAVFLNRDDLRGEDYQDYYFYLPSFTRKRFEWELQIRRRKFERQLKLMSRYAPGRRLLDVGAGPGYLVRMALHLGWDARGVEISEEAVRHGRKVFGVEYVPLQDVADQSLDVITCYHVLEHIPEPAPFLDLLNRKLKPGGLLAFHVPHRQPFTFAIRSALRRLRGRTETMASIYEDIHITGFTRDSLQRFVERHGFGTHFTRTVGMWSAFYDPFFLGNYVRDRAWVPMVRKFLRHVIETTGIPFGFGDVVVGYFRKLPGEVPPEGSGSGAVAPE